MTRNSVNTQPTRSEHTPDDQSLSGPLHDLSARIQQLPSQITADQSAIAQLTKTSASNDTHQLQLAKARLALDPDELEDAQQDLAVKAAIRMRRWSANTL
jgi:hypothetical protein